MTSTPKEVNSKHSNSLGKRKKVREKRGNDLQKWLEKSMQCTLDSIPGVDTNDMINPTNHNFWNQQIQGTYGQRLFNATSDPSVFRYSAPFPYSQEPLSLPIFSPLYPPLFPGYPAPTPYNVPIKATPKIINNNRRKYGNRRPNGIDSASGTLQNESAKSKSNTSSVVNNNDFASLPPGINQFPDNLNSVFLDDNSSDSKRRFSDPGIVQNLDASNDESLEESDADSSANEGSQPDSKILMCLVDQINSLKESNRKLYKELHETKAELESLKHQTSMWRSESLPRQSPQSSHLGVPPSVGLANSSSMYTPGMLADLVREIREAAKLREEALYSRVKCLLEDRYSNNKMNGNSQMDWRHIEHNNYKSQGHMNGVDKSKNQDIIHRLEEDLQRLRFQQSREEASNSLNYSGSFTSPMNLSHQHNNSDLDRARLRAELSKERAAREAADAHVHKLELMVTQLSKRGHHNSSHTPPHGNSSMVTSPSEALHMVLGPVTDL